MDNQLIVGIVFAAITCLFFIVAYFFKPPTPNQAPILRILVSLCAGAAAAFFVGSTAINVTGQLSEGAKWVVSGTGGFALFILVWLTYPTPKAPAGLNISFPQGTHFEGAARAIGDAMQLVVDVRGFSDAEKNTLLTSTHLQEKDAVRALTALASMVPANSIRAFRVEAIPGGHKIEPV
jgi:hypothetical protein